MKWRRNKKAWINRYHIHHNIISLCLYFLCRPVSKKFFAGAGVGDTSAWGGAFTFNVTNLPSDPWWTVGSAYNLSRDILYVWRYESRLGNLLFN